MTNTTFEREHIRHPMAVRRLTVSGRRELGPAMVRYTVTGPELTGFSADGPTDHIKVFFPDPATGILTAPSVTDEGVHRPTDGVILSRDYTPLAFRPGAAGDPPELDIDVVLHGDNGPASAWGAHAEIGSPLAIGGPRGSRLAPTGVRRAILVADETAMPAMSRWVSALPADCEITAIVELGDEGLEGYFGAAGERMSIEWLYRFDGPGQLEEAVRSLGTIGDDTYVWAAGEATALIPVRRHLRRELGLPAEQVVVQGYWKRGVTNLDHHAPVDPSDPD